MRQAKDIYREACGRSHRILGAYLTLWAWRKGADCVALDRDHLLPYLGVGKMRGKRLRWLAEDIREFFPYHQALQISGRTVHGGLYLSRAPFPDHAFEAGMSDEKRAKQLSSRGLRTSVGRLPSEDRMIAALATAATGAAARGSSAARALSSTGCSSVRRPRHPPRSQLMSDLAVQWTGAASSVVDAHAAQRGR